MSPTVKRVSATRIGKLNTATLQQPAPVFAAPGDETPLRLIAVLCAGSAMSIAQLTAGRDTTRQSLTRHLQVLANAGLVRDVKVGRECQWEVEADHLDEARRARRDLAAVGSGVVEIEGDGRGVRKDEAESTFLERRV